MKHALIIEDNTMVSRIIEEKLIALGFRSFEHVWTENAAVAAAKRCLPDLVVVGDSVTAGSGIEAARRICSAADLPVLLVTANGPYVRRHPPEGARLEGPFPLAEMGRAVKSVSDDGRIAI